MTARERAREFAVLRVMGAFRNRHIGVIPQGRTALRSLTVLENVLLPSRLYVQKSENVLEYRDRALTMQEGRLSGG